MKKYKLEQAHMNAGKSYNRHPESEIHMPGIDMESVGSRRNRSHDYGHEHREQGGNRLPQVAMAGAVESGGFSNQRVRMSAMAELKEFSGREKNEKRARK